MTVARTRTLNAPQPQDGAALEFVLIVEDDEGLSNLARRALRRAGYEADSVATGAEAIEHVTAHPHAVLLLDQHLPDMTGTELIHALAGRGLRVPFIAMTGHGDEKVAVELMKLGARDYLVKGLGLTDLLPEVYGRLFRELDTERRLAQAERDYRRLFTEMHIGFALHEIICDKEGRPTDYRFLAINPAFERLTGLRAEDLIDRTVREVLPDTEPLWIERYGHVALTGEPTRFENYSQALGRYYGVSAFQPIPGQFACFVEDITARRRTQQALKESESRFRAFMDHFPARAYTKDNQLRLIYGNRTVLERSGLSIQEWVGTTAADYLRPEVAQRLEAADREVLEQQRVVEVEFCQKGRSGQPEWVRDIKFPLKGPDHQEMIGGISLDVTERVLAQEALRASEQQKDLILNGANEMIAYYDIDLRILWANRAAGESVGRSPRELVGAFCYDIWNAGVPCENCPVLRARDTKRPQQHERQTPDGRWWNLRGYPVLDDDGEVIALVEFGQDITERKAAERERESLEAQLVQAQRMEAVGRLAGGVAHDFNNMLAVILGRAELALDALGESDPVRQELGEIQNAAQRSANLTRQLLAFARRQTISPEVLNLNETLTAMTKMLQRLMGEDIDLVWKPGAALWPIKIDPSQVDQILANLCVNARDAIDGVGKVTIETRNAIIDANPGDEQVECVPSEYVLLIVSDDGCGMDDETMGHLFEPFFTTKDLGQGTGLGLATVYGIVKQNEGTIHVESEPGVGTTFRIGFRRHVSKVEQIESIAQEGVVARGHETILLVEDEPAILHLGQALLERMGYRVVAAATPGEAMRAAEAYPGIIHLLMTDVIMPEMNGRDLVRRVLTLYPHIKRLFTSGYTADVIAHHGVLDPGVAFLPKPYARDTLARKVREVLDET